MRISTEGLVLREVKTGESDRILSILTPKHGIISASARGSLRPKSKLFSATGLFTYSEFTLFEGKSMYRVDEAAPIELFFGLRESVEGVALATYIAEMLQILSPTGREAARLLRLALNSLHILSRGKREPLLVKSIFELRSLSESGFMPNLLACRECGRYDGGLFYFDPQRGDLLCAECAQQAEAQPNLDPAALAALRHIVLSDDEKVFGFTLKANSVAYLQQATEAFTLFHLDYPPKSLSFLKTIFGVNT